MEMRPKLDDSVLNMTNLCGSVVPQSLTHTQIWDGYGWIKIQEPGDHGRPQQINPSAYPGDNSRQEWAHVDL